MRIAQVAPLFERVPPVKYGGTERVVSFLTEELVSLGHEVTLFAAGDSTTAAALVACTPRSLRTDPTCRDQLPHHVRQLEEVSRLAASFDIIHFHSGYLHYPLASRMSVPHVTTLHGRLDLDDLVPLFTEFAGMPVVSISDAQRRPFPDLNWRATVPHGLPSSLYTTGRGTGDYLLFLGRIAPEKAPVRAIEIARRAGRKLLIAAKVDRVDREYYEQLVKPQIDGRTVEYLGEVSDAEKQALLGEAYAFLFPIDWPEPFGIVLIESLACGTPIVAWPCGSLPEIVEEGRTGFLVTSIEAAVEALDRVPSLSRVDIRRAFEERFTIDTMTRRYLALYGGLTRRTGLNAEAVA